MNIVKGASVSINSIGDVRRSITRNGFCYAVGFEGMDFSGEILVTPQQAIHAMSSESIEIDITQGGPYVIDVIDFDSGTVSMSSESGRVQLNGVPNDVAVDMLGCDSGWNILFTFK